MFVIVIQKKNMTKEGDTKKTHVFSLFNLASIVIDSLSKSNVLSLFLPK